MIVAFLKLLIAALATLGVFFPAHTHVYLCAPGKTPSSAPSSCERIAVT